MGRERGFSLIVSLMMLVVIIILGIGASQMAINEERGARNDRDRQIAFQAAEAAIKDAEQEIYGPTQTTCNLTNEVGRGKMRVGTRTCFNQTNTSGYVAGCSAPPNQGLCDVNLALPAYLDSTNVDFYKDATGAGNNHTVAYGTFTNKTYPTQAGTSMGANAPVSAYAPRYIIELVAKTTSVDSLTEGGKWMFRITAMGFGANPNSQVVLQAVVATQD